MILMCLGLFQDGREDYRASDVDDPDVCGFATGLMGRITGPVMLMILMSVIVFQDGGEDQDYWANDVDDPVVCGFATGWRGEFLGQ